MTPPTTKYSSKIDLIKELVHLYYLAKATNYQAQFVREYVNEDFKKIISVLKAKNNHFCSQIETFVPKHEIGNIDEITMQVLENVYSMNLNATE